MMEKELVNTVMHKKFIELNSSEKEALMEWCATEEEYDQLYQVFNAVETLKKDQIISPKQETKKSLDELFAQKHSRITPVIWYNSILLTIYPKEKAFIKRPLIQLAALAMILLLVYPFVSNNKIVEPIQQQAKLEKEFEPTIQEKEAVNNLKQEKEIEKSLESILPIIGQEENLREMSSDILVNDELVVSKSGKALPASDMFLNSQTKTDFKKSDHPDGIYLYESTISYSQPASSQPAIFDLLTASF